MAQQITGDDTTTLTPYKDGPPTADAMSGFAQNYQDRTSVDSSTISQIMNYFLPEQLPVTTFLATNYSVCDNWFASAPTQTFANRAFSTHAAPNVASQGGSGDWLTSRDENAAGILGAKNISNTTSNSTGPFSGTIVASPSFLNFSTVTIYYLQASAGPTATITAKSQNAALVVTALTNIPSGALPDIDSLANIQWWSITLKDPPSSFTTTIALSSDGATSVDIPVQVTLHG